jgi:hypothetical protein
MSSVFAPSKLIDLVVEGNAHTVARNAVLVKAVLVKAAFVKAVLVKAGPTFCNGRMQSSIRNGRDKGLQWLSKTQRRVKAVCLDTDTRPCDLKECAIVCARA